jgi:hypothetical protein
MDTTEHDQLDAEEFAHRAPLEDWFNDYASDFEETP